jgi:hypothetical protein
VVAVALGVAPDARGEVGEGLRGKRSQQVCLVIEVSVGGGS